MSSRFYDRKPRETDAQYILRLYLDPWFEEATPAEVADFTGISCNKVRRVLYAWVKSLKVRRIHGHATSIAEQIGWAGTPEGLVHTALELFVQRAQKRERVKQIPIDDEIRHFLARNRTASEARVSSLRTAPGPRERSDDRSEKQGAKSATSVEA